MVKKNWRTEEGKTVTKYKDWARFVQNNSKRKPSRNLKINHSLIILSAFELTLKNIKLHMKAEETTLEEPVQTEIL